MKLQIADVIKESIVDGPGIRYAIYVQGCPHNCKGCHNLQTHDFNGGTTVDTKQLFEECVSSPLHTGVTFTGGEPFCQPDPLYELGLNFKAHGLSIWCYSGWTFEELHEKTKHDPSVARFLSVIDVLVDGPFIEAQRNLTLPFRGSTNQRLVDVYQSLSSGLIVLANIT